MTNWEGVVGAGEHQISHRPGRCRMIYRLTNRQVDVLMAAIAFYETDLDDRELQGENVRSERQLLDRANLALLRPVREGAG